MKSCMQTPNLLPGETLDPFILFLVIKISLLRDSLHWSIFWTVYVQHLDCFGRGNYHTARILQSNFVDTYRCIVVVVKRYSGRYHYVYVSAMSFQIWHPSERWLLISLTRIFLFNFIGILRNFEKIKKVSYILSLRCIGT